MKLLPLIFAAILASGCGSRPLREEPAKPPPPPSNPGDEPVDTGSEDDIPVAFIDKEPVMYREVVDHSMSARGKELIDKYILWKLRRDRLEELGIKNSQEDLRRRAELIITAQRKTSGEEQFKKYLEARKLTEAAYVDAFVANAEFDEHVRTEKAVAYAMLTEAAIEIDTVAFTETQEAATFSVLANRTSFSQAVERLQAAPDLKGKVGYWPRHRFPQGLAPEVIAAAPELEKKLFAMSKGQTSAPETAKNNIIVVVHLVNTYPATKTTYAAVADKVMAELLRQPPGQDQIALWMERLLKSRNIRYEPRYTPRNQGR
jgi:hypothetical protein